MAFFPNWTYIKKKIIGASNDASKFVNGQGEFVTIATEDETDPIFSASEAASFATGDKAKLDGITTGAEVNINADWNSITGDSEILNKPTIPTQYTDELAQDAVGGILNNTGNVQFTYDDATPKVTAVVDLSGKVDVVIGKGLSTNDYDDAAETKLAGIEALAEVNNISDANATDLTDAGATTLHKHDHGGMDGLADDDHTQYVKKAGDTMSGNLDFANYKAIALACDNGTSFPATPATAQWFYRSDIKTLFIYEGVWKAICSFGAVTLYVDGASGTDAVGQGYSSGAGATKTIQYAIDLIPPINGGNVVVNVVGATYQELVTIRNKQFAGSYTLQIVGDVSISQATATLNGATDAVTTYSNGTQATIKDASQAWGVNAQANRIFRIVAGSGYDSTNTWKNDYIIESNTADTLTLIGGAYFSTPVANGATPTQYQIIDFNTIIDGNSSLVNNIYIASNNVIFKNIKFQQSTSSNIYLDGAKFAEFFSCYIYSTVAAAGTNIFRVDNQSILANCNAVNLSSTSDFSLGLSILSASKTHIDPANLKYGVTNSMFNAVFFSVNVGQFSYFWANQSYGNKIKNSGATGRGIVIIQFGTAAIKNTIVDMTGSTGNSYGIEAYESASLRLNSGCDIFGSSLHGIYAHDGATLNSQTSGSKVRNNTGYGLYVANSAGVAGALTNITFSTNTLGDTIFFVDTGNIQINSATETLKTIASASTKIAQVTKGAASQSANLQEWQKSDATVYSSKSSVGVDTSPNYISTVATGTAPFACTSTTANTNLNADLLDGQHGSYYAPLASPVFTTPIRLKGYTVGTLPGGTQGDTAFVTDALAPTFLATVVGGGAVVTPVFYNGTNWVGY